MAVSSYGASVVLQNNSGSAAASGAPTGSVFLFASGAVGSAKLFMNKEGSASDLELGSLKVAGDSGAETISAGETLTIAGGTGLDTALSSGTITFTMDLNELSAATVDVAADSIAIIDANDSNGSKKEAIADVVTAVAGNGLAASSGVLAVDLNELSAAAVAVGADSIAIIDADDNGSKKEAIADLATAQAGVGLSATSGVFAVDLNELSAASVNVGNDSIAIIDADDSNGSKKESIADLATAMAGVGIAASSGQFVLDISELSDVQVASGDKFLMLDSDDSTEQLESVDDLATFMAGDGLAASSGVLAVQVGTNKGLALTSDKLEITGSAVADGTLAVGTDSFMFFDSDGSVKEESFADLSTAQAGAGLAATSGVLAVVNATNGGLNVNANDINLDLNDLAAAAVAVDADSIAIIDGDDSNATKKESIADLMTAVAGDGLAASSGVLAVGVDDTGIEINSDALRLKDNGVTLAKMAGITRGSMIIGDASGDPSLLAKGTSGQFLQSDGTDPSYVSMSGDVASLASGGAVTLAAAQTNITSILATDLKIGEDDQTKIDFETADEIHFYAANAEQVYVADGVFGPQTDSDVDLGADGVAFKKLFVDDIDLNGQGRIDLDADADTSIRSAADDQIQFELGGSDRFTMGATGMNFGAGYGSGGTSLGVDGTVNTGGNINAGADGSGVDLIVYGGASNERMMYDASEHVLQFRNSSGATMLNLGGDSSSEYALDVANGSDNINKVRAAAFVTYSDESLKSDVASMGNTALDTVMSLEGVEFTWKDSGERDFGFIAQDVQSVLPKAVHVAEDGVQGVDYSRLTSVLVEAVKAQQVQIEDLKKVITNLKK